jgi:hypothetical protein
VPKKRRSKERARELQLAEARRERRNIKRVSKQVAPWLLENAEVNAISDVWQKNIPAKTETIPHDKHRYDLPREDLNCLERW